MSFRDVPAQSAPSGSGPTGTVSSLDLSKLGSLTNYAGTVTDNCTSISVSVHSPTDWSETLGSSPALHIDGTSYGKSINAQGQPVWSKNADNPQAYQSSPYPGQPHSSPACPVLCRTWGPGSGVSGSAVRTGGLLFIYTMTSVVGVPVIPVPSPVLSA